MRILKLNLKKTEIIPIGKLKNKKNILPIDLNQIKVKHGPFKALGTWFSNNEQEIIELNFADRIKSIEKLQYIWSSRSYL